MGVDKQVKSACLDKSGFMKSFYFIFIHWEHVSCCFIYWFNLGSSIFETFFLPFRHLLLVFILDLIICVTKFPKISTQFLTSTMNHFASSFFSSCVRSVLPEPRWPLQGCPPNGTRSRQEDWAQSPLPRLTCTPGINHMKISSICYCLRRRDKKYDQLTLYQMT